MAKPCDVTGFKPRHCCNCNLFRSNAHEGNDHDHQPKATLFLTSPKLGRWWRGMSHDFFLAMPAPKKQAIHGVVREGRNKSIPWTTLQWLTPFEQWDCFPGVVDPRSDKRTKSKSWIHRNRMKHWVGFLLGYSMVFCSSLHQFRHPSFPVSLTAGVVSTTAAGGSAGGAKTTEGTKGTWGPRAPKGTAGTYGAGKIGKGWDLCGFDMLDISCRNMFWGLADFRWLWVDFIVWYFVVSCAVLWVPTCQKRIPEI